MLSECGVNLIIQTILRDLSTRNYIGSSLSTETSEEESSTAQVTKLTNLGSQRSRAKKENGKEYDKINNR
jgi:hypothetical protein